MKKYILILFIAVLCAVPFFLLKEKEAYKYKFTIAAMFKNEAEWLKEWIVYHSDVLRAEHFYLYNNDSTDNYKEVLQPFIEKGLVELIEWESGNPTHKIDDPIAKAPWDVYQIGAYNDCLRNRAHGVAKWVAMIDIDEYIVPSNGIQSFYQLLDRAERHKKGTVKLLWKIFGTSGVKHLSAGEMLTERLTFRAPDDHPWHLERKSIYRPEAVNYCMIHESRQLKDGYGAKTADPNLFRIHHYWTRTEEVLNKKRKSSLLNPFCQNLNSVEDRSITPYISTLEKGMKKQIE